jgi:hypothetical protein
LITNIIFHITRVVNGLSTDSSWKSPSYRGIKLGMLARFSSEPPEADMAGSPCAAVIESTKAPCTFKPNLPSKYCNKHKVLWERKDEVAAAGGRECKQLATHVKRGCLGMLDADDKSCCKACKRMNAEKDKKVDARREAAAVASLRPGQVVCNNCKEPKDASEFDEHALSHATKGAYCKSCREKREGAEKRRVVTDSRVERKREYEMSEERRASKMARKEADPEKFAQYSRNSRARRKEADPEAYLKKQAGDQLRHRNRELVLTGPNGDITGAEFIIQEGGTCFYCGDGGDEHPLTVGKMDLSDESLDARTFVPLCVACSRMKGRLDALTFVERCVYIHGKREGTEKRPCPIELFPDHKRGGEYAGIVGHARLRNLALDVTESDVKQVCQQDCYICGKKNSELHTNGVDREDDNKGYILENVRPACGGCNFMKGSLKIEKVFEKISKVAARASDHIGKIPKDIVRRNKIF